MIPEETRKMLEAVMQRLTQGAGVQTRIPPHLHPPRSSRPLNLVAGYRGFTVADDIDPIIEYTVPDDHNAVIRSWAIGVDSWEQEYNQGTEVWLDPTTYRLLFYVNNHPWPLLNPPGTRVAAGAHAITGELQALVNEASPPTAVAAGGSVTSQLNDNPFGLHKTNPTFVPLEGGDVVKLVYRGPGGQGEETARIYARLTGWLWREDDDPRWSEE